MILYFCAALGFLVTGILEVYVYRGQFWLMLLYTVMVLAAIFGILSSFFVNKDPDVAFILNTVSVHLFALEAISIIISRYRKLKKLEMEAFQKAYDKSKDGKVQDDSIEDFSELDSCLGLPVMAWLGLGDISFFIGSSGDVVLSYFYILEKDYVEHAVVAIVTAVFWLLASLFYVGVSSYELHTTKKRFHKAGLHEKQRDVRKVQLIIIALILLAAAIIVLGLVFGYDTTEEESGFGDEGTFVPTAYDTDMLTDASATDSTMNVTGACNLTMSTFSQSTMSVTMAVMATITAVEVSMKTS
jgi:hypothetical protein